MRDVTAQRRAVLPVWIAICAFLEEFWSVVLPGVQRTQRSRWQGRLGPGWRLVPAGVRLPYSVCVSSLENAGGHAQGVEGQGQGRQGPTHGDPLTTKGEATRSCM